MLWSKKRFGRDIHFGFCFERFSVTSTIVWIINIFGNCQPLSTVYRCRRWWPAKKMTRLSTMVIIIIIFHLRLGTIMPFLRINYNGSARATAEHFFSLRDYILKWFVVTYMKIKSHIKKKLNYYIVQSLDDIFK